MKPPRQLLAGYSASEFKTLLRRLGFQVPRDFFSRGSVAEKHNRLYRFRHWSEGFPVDVSDPVEEFDRWANSVARIVPFEDLVKEQLCLK